MHAVWRGSSFQRVRLGSGLILFAFAAAHFLNHALGLYSLDAMIVFDHWRTAITRSLVGTIILGLALASHALLALIKMASRRTLRLPAWELWQAGLGVAIPFFLLPHMVNTRVTNLLFGVDTSYPYELVKIWPATIVDQTVLLLLVWVHGCIGLHFWLRLSRLYRKLAPFLLAGAVLLPFAAFTGVMFQGRALNAEIADPARFADLKTATHWPDEKTTARIVELRLEARLLFYSLFGAVALALALRLLTQRWRRRIPVQYVAGPLVKTGPGPTLLELSRMNGIPHMSVCGGRARCSTCRIMVMSAESGLQPPSEPELRTLAAIDAGPGVRLACQARPIADTTIMQLMKVGDDTFSHVLNQYEAAGIEYDLAVLCVDMRGFTSLTRDKLAFDVVFILNQFFATVGKPIYDLGGWISNYAGDGLVALFSDQRGIDKACRSALLAAAEIDRAVVALSSKLGGEISQPIRVAMGLHVGPHVLGRVGYRESQTMSVIGLAVNVASRMETMAKAAGVQLVLSESVARYAGLDTTDLRSETAEVRGLNTPLAVILVDRALDLVSRLRQPELQGWTDPRVSSDHALGGIEGA